MGVEINLWSWSVGWDLVHSEACLMDSKEWRGTPCNWVWCSDEDPCRAALNSWVLGSGAHTGHPGSLATVNQASSKLDVVLEFFAVHWDGVIVFWTLAAVNYYWSLFLVSVLSEFPSSWGSCFQFFVEPWSSVLTPLSLINRLILCGTFINTLLK